MKWRLLGLILLVYAGLTRAEYAYIRIHPTLIPYLHEFYQDCAKYKANCPPLDTINLEMSLTLEQKDTLIPNAIASCVIYSSIAGIERRVTILHTFDPVALKATTYHELFHCILLQKHPTEEDTRLLPLALRPFSLLDPYHRYDTEFYVDNWDALVKADFERSKQ